MTNNIIHNFVKNLLCNKHLTGDLKKNPLNVIKILFFLFKLI